MRAMVLAAGLGTRMRPLSDLLAKPALPLLNRPLLHWTLERLAFNGIDRVVVNTHHLPASVRRAAATASTLGLRVSFSHEPELLGSGGGPRQARARLGEGPVLLVNGDVVFDLDLNGLLGRHLRSHAAATLALRANPDPARYPPVVTDERGRVLSIRSLPRPAEGRDGLFTGVHVVDAGLLERLPEGPSDIVSDLYAPLLAEGARIEGPRVKGTWHDLGTPSLYLAAHHALLAGRSVIDPTARVHPRSIVEGSAVGARGVVEEDARVEGSVLWQGVRIGAGARVRDSILTARTRIEAGEQVERCIVLPTGRQAIA